MSKIYRIFRTITILFLLGSGSLFAQRGDYLITNHKPDINNIDNTNFQIIQDQQGLMYFANRAGVLVYDGVEWDFYGTPGAALAMTFGRGGEKYVACLNDFGKIDYHDNGIKYVSLSGEFGKSIGMIYQAVHFRNQVIFVGENILYVYDEVSDKTKSYTLENPSDYYNMVFVKDSVLYANTSDGAIARLDDTFKSDSVFYLPDSSNLAFIRQNKNTGTVIAGTYASDIYNLSGNTIKMLKCSDYLTSNNIQLVDGYWYDDKKFVIGTLERGCLITDIADRQNKMDTVDFDNGLPDNEVSALYVDNSQGIWVAHEFGLSRIAPELPIRSFTHYPGLEGNLYAWQRYHGKLFISTSVGIYFLDEVKNYKRTVYYVHKGSNRVKSNNGTRAENGTTKKGSVDKKQERRGFLGLFRARKKQDNDKEESSDNGNKDKSRPGFFKRLFTGFSGETDKVKRKDNVKDYQRKVRTELQSIEYSYKPVEGIKAKCRQMVPFNGKLLVVSNSGIFEIENDQGTLIIPEPTRYMYADTVNNRLILCGYDRTVKIYMQQNDIWVEDQNVPFNEIITSAGMDNQNNLWLSSPSRVYRCRIAEDTFEVSNTYKIRNPLIDVPVMTTIGGKYYFIFTTGYYYYDGDTVREDDNYKAVFGLPVQYIQSPDGLVWIFNGKTWNRINPDGRLESFEYLSLFPDMRFISYDPRRDVYRIVTSSNKLFVYEHYLSKKMQPASDLILRRIASNNGLISDHKKIILNWDDNTISFKFSEPDYLGLLKVEYQYKLLDHMKVWSEWSEVNSVNLNYLQPGKNSLMVRARDTFGRIKEADVIQFRVKPPYWKQPWFYVLELLFIGSLILLVKSLRRINIRWPFIVDGLGILTLVIILALIQSTIQTYFNIKSTPVADFIVNVVVAIIALPLEEKLRKLLI